MRDSALVVLYFCRLAGPVGRVPPGRAICYGARAIMQRILWLDAAILAVGATFILFIVAEALHHLLMAAGVVG